MQIVNWIIAIIPSLTAIATACIAIYKMVKALAETRKEVTDMKDLEEIKVQMQVILQENANLKQVIYEMLEKIDKVKRKE